jgi:hypothetical protein
MYVNGDENTTGDSEGQSEYINQRIELVFEDAANGNDQVIAEHIK